jgi:hypothetical protein
MDNSFFVYLQQFELLAFFSGYPLLYTIVFAIAGKRREEQAITSTIALLTPFAYALTGSLFLGLQIKKLYPIFSHQPITASIAGLFLTVWGLCSLLFWMPVFTKKHIYSLLHSLVFFFLFVKILFEYSISPDGDKHLLQNAVKMYTGSFLLNIFSLAVVTAIYYLYHGVNNWKKK